MGRGVVKEVCPVSFPSDGEIANAAELWPITKVATERLGIDDPQVLVPYGHDKAKLDLAYVSSLRDRPDGKLVLVTAISPTPAGEGKTTTTVGLTDALQRIGQRSCAALREPSMGPVFGMKGGAAGGGYAQVVPMTDINLHFTGDFAAIAAANNLLAALIDNHIHHGNALGIDIRTITWKRVVDLNDRALRDDRQSGSAAPRTVSRAKTASTSSVASELMAIFCLAESLIADLKEPHRATSSWRTRATRSRSSPATSSAEGALAGTPEGRAAAQHRADAGAQRPPSSTVVRSPTSRTAATR
jgi:formate--tetrahydrofolate ligase